MNTYNSMSVSKWLHLRREVAGIQKATASGTPSFVQRANSASSRIYSCYYYEIGRLWCDTMCIKDGRKIITEQDLRYRPKKVRFYYSQTPAVTVFKELQDLVLPHLVKHQSDLLKHDYNKIVTNNNSCPFIIGYCNTGTDMLQMPPTIEEITHQQWFQRHNGTDAETRKSLLEYHTVQLNTLTRENKDFLYFNGYNFLACTKEKLRGIYLQHIQKLCADWRTTTIKLVKPPSLSLA